MNFRSVAQLSDQLVGWTKRLPSDIDVVVGIPRSGLLVANLLALYRNLPLADLDGFLHGHCLAAGCTRSNPLSGDGSLGPHGYLSEPRKVLVVDDSVRSGKTIRKTQERIAAAGLAHSVMFGAVYVTAESAGKVDTYCEIVEPPRAFEWNILNHHTLQTSCVDMDGVLCNDPSPHENDDGQSYLEFLRSARPLLRPPYPIGYIVTNRLERYRPQTEAWLQRQRIKYGQLIMLDYPDGETRRLFGTYSAHKARVYRNTRAELFIESDVRQAMEIAVLSRKEVLCVDTMQLISPGSLPIARPAWPLESRHKRSLGYRLAHRFSPQPLWNGLKRLRGI